MEGIDIKSVIKINDNYTVLGYKFIPTREDCKEILLKYIQSEGCLPNRYMSISICKLKEFYSINKSIEIKTIKEEFNWKFIIDIAFND